MQRDVYLPLQISQRDSVASKPCCRVVLLPGRELEEVYITLAPVDSSGVRGRNLQESVPLRFGYYPAGRRIAFPLAGVTRPGVYVAQIAATLRGGGSAGIELWFYNPRTGPPLLDLAALTSGRWVSDNRIAMTDAYREGARAAGVRCPSLGELMRGTTACRLLLAMQWLGWAAGWMAPVDHRNDWLVEAERCAEELSE